jgi:hypothetical protein
MKKTIFILMICLSGVMSNGLTGSANRPLSLSAKALTGLEVDEVAHRAMIGYGLLDEKATILNALTDSMVYQRNLLPETLKELEAGKIEQLALISTKKMLLTKEPGATEQRKATIESAVRREEIKYEWLDGRTTIFNALATSIACQLDLLSEAAKGLEAEKAEKIKNNAIWKCIYDQTVHRATIERLFEDELDVLDNRYRTEQLMAQNDLELLQLAMEKADNPDDKVVAPRTASPESVPVPLRVLDAAQEARRKKLWADAGLK